MSMSIYKLLFFDLLCLFLSMPVDLHGWEESVIGMYT